MAYNYKFQKILQLREREKEETQTLYNESLKQFEAAAEKLYSLLKRKRA